MNGIGENGIAHAGIDLYSSIAVKGDDIACTDAANGRVYCAVDDDAIETIGESAGAIQVCTNVIAPNYRPGRAALRHGNATGCVAGNEIARRRCSADHIIPRGIYKDAGGDIAQGRHAAHIRANLVRFDGVCGTAKDVDSTLTIAGNEIAEPRNADHIAGNASDVAAAVKQHSISDIAQAGSARRIGANQILQNLIAGSRKEQISVYEDTGNPVVAGNDIGWQQTGANLIV